MNGQEPPAPTGIEYLPAGLADGLCARSAYPLDPSAATGVSTVQTHISHVFLTGSRVYKLRKAVNLGFLDFGTRAVRNDDCLREVTLNRRLAADVYMGLAPVEIVGRDVRVGAIQEVLSRSGLEHCVVMRRLPNGRDSVSLLNEGAFDERHVDAIARAIVRFHQSYALGRPAPFTAGEWLAAVSGPVEDNFAPMAGVIDANRVSHLAHAARDFLGANRDEFEKRRLDGRAVDGHGDLHLAHVWFETADSAPLFIDCLEFSERLRHIDAASEVAFLAMDLRYRGRSDLAERLLRRYATGTDDFHLYAVVDYFLSYRAAVRAKVAAIAAGESELPADQRRAARDSASRHLDLASEAFTSGGRGAVVMMTGVVGTGKSTAADVVADGLGTAAVIASDRVRKHLAGLSASARTGAAVDEGMYSKAFTQRVYDGMLERAARVAASGRAVVLDATFSRPEQREAVAEFARGRGLPLCVVETRGAEERVLQRLAERERGALDPSDAGPSFYAESVARFAPVQDVGYGTHLVVDTDGPAWRIDLTRRVRAWRDHASHGSPGRPK